MIDYEKFFIVTALLGIVPLIAVIMAAKVKILKSISDEEITKESI